MKLRKLFLLLTAFAAVAFLISSRINFRKTFTQLRTGNSDVEFVAAPDSVPLALNAKAYNAVNKQSQQPPLSFLTGLDNDLYQADSPHNSGYLYIETKIDSFVNDQTERVPLNISIVIDHSGSMAGEKMQYAKMAAKNMVDMMSENDMLSIVIYDSEVELLQAATKVVDKAAIKARIDKILDRGSTNLWGGTQMGYEQVKAHYNSNYVNRVFLITDGLANEGITDPALIRSKVLRYKNQEGITLSTFGVGLDYNEDLLTPMAEAGAGNYYFIDNPGKMVSVFSKELNGMMNVAAQNAELRVAIPAGVSVQKVYPFKYEQQGNEIVIRFRDLFSQETKAVLIQFGIKPGTSNDLAFISRLSYTDVRSKTNKEIRHENILRPCASREQYLSYYNEPVLQQVILFVANERMEQAMLEADKGDFKKARTLVQYNDGYLKANSKLVSKSEELRKLESSNTVYSDKIKNGESLSADSVKYLQKSSKSINYEFKTKKSKRN